MKNAAMDLEYQNQISEICEHIRLKYTKDGEDILYGEMLIDGLLDSEIEFYSTLNDDGKINALKNIKKNFYFN